jgi:hypothetical protein
MPTAHPRLDTMSSVVDFHLQNLIGVVLLLASDRRQPRASDAHWSSRISAVHRQLHRSCLKEPLIRTAAA